MNARTGTILPSEMYPWMSAPFLLPLSRSARSRSPADRCTKPYFSTMRPHCVPLPAPGPPKTKITWGLPRGVVAGAALACTGVCVSGRSCAAAPGTAPSARHATHRCGRKRRYRCSRGEQGNTSRASRESRLPASSTTAHDGGGGGGGRLGAYLPGGTASRSDGIAGARGSNTASTNSKARQHCGWKRGTARTGTAEKWGADWRDARCLVHLLRSSHGGQDSWSLGVIR